MQSKYAWLISLADDISDLEMIWYVFSIDADLNVLEKNRIMLLFCERYDKLKGRI